MISVATISVAFSKSTLQLCNLLKSPKSTKIEERIQNLVGSLVAALKINFAFCFEELFLERLPPPQLVPHHCHFRFSKSRNNHRGPSTRRLLMIMGTQDEGHAAIDCGGVS